MRIDRRRWLKWAFGSGLATPLALQAQETRPQPPLKITALRVSPIALPDPPILAASGCHGPYFLRTILQLECDGHLVGIGETYGSQRTIEQLGTARPFVVSQKRSRGSFWNAATRRRFGLCAASKIHFAYVRRHFEGPPQGIMIRQRQAEIVAEEKAVGEIV